MDPISAQLISRALDGLSMRQLATAENIANAGTHSFRPLRVSFEAALRTAATQGPEAIAQVRPELTQAPLPDGDLRIDLELATASQTALRYAALIDLLGRQIQISRTAIRGGQ
jgi:flagellar basal-body rod protein FlgB